MPTYQYECDACGHALEVYQSIVDKKLRKCPRCQKFKLHRLIGKGSGIVFKGSGFYETDYKRPKDKALAKSTCSEQGRSARTEQGRSARTGKDQSTCPLKSDASQSCSCVPKN